jgi:hypothetical protein
MGEIRKISDASGRDLCIIVRKDFEKDGIEFFSNEDDFLQLGYMKREEGYEIAPHIHIVRDRMINKTQEVIFIKSGKVEVALYDYSKQFIEKVVVSTGDILILLDGGHGFKMLEKSEMIEVKQGPYVPIDDKIRFA